MEIQTRYRYLNDWQYQKIFVDLDNGNIIRKQNYMDRDGIVFETKDVFTREDKEYNFLWNEYGRDAVVDYVRGV